MKKQEGKLLKIFLTLSIFALIGLMGCSSPGSTSSGGSGVDDYAGVPSDKSLTINPDSYYEFEGARTIIQGTANKYWNGESSNSYLIHFGYAVNDEIQYTVNIPDDFEDALFAIRYYYDCPDSLGNLFDIAFDGESKGQIQTYHHYGGTNRPPYWELNQVANLGRVTAGTHTINIKATNDLFVKLDVFKIYENPNIFVASWNMNENEGGTNLADVSGNGNDGVIYDAVWTCDGISGNGLYFDGNGDYVDIPDLNLTGDFSIEFWVNLNPGIDNGDAIVGQGGAGQDINFYAGKLRLFNPDPSKSYVNVLEANSYAVANAWTHYAVTREGSDVKLYINGVLDDEGVWSTEGDYGAFKPKTLGYGNVGAHLGGILDEISIYNVALSSEAILGIYEKYVDARVYDLKYTMNQEDGDVLLDTSGNENNGIIHNARFTRRGVSESALQFDGNGDWVDMPNVNLTDDFSIEFWVLLSYGIDNADSIVGQEGAGQDINFYQGYMRLFAPESQPVPGVNDVVIANTCAVQMKWTHYAVTREAGIVKLYVNGTLDAEGAYEWRGAFIPKAIGRGNLGAYFNGVIDELAIYSRCLTDEEVLASYKKNNNIALRKPSYSSSYSHIYNQAQRAFDGDYGTDPWRAEPGVPQWIYVDLEEVKNISEIRMLINYYLPTENGAKDFVFQYGEPGNWIDMLGTSITDASKYDWHYFDVENIQSRYIRCYITDQYGERVEIQEIMVYEK